MWSFCATLDALSPPPRWWLSTADVRHRTPVAGNQRSLGTLTTLAHHGVLQPDPRPDLEAVEELVRQLAWRPGR